MVARVYTGGSAAREIYRQFFIEVLQPIFGSSGSRDMTKEMEMDIAIAQKTCSLARNQMTICSVKRSAKWSYNYLAPLFFSGCIVTLFLNDFSRMLSA